MGIEFRGRPLWGVVAGVVVVLSLCCLCGLGVWLGDSAGSDRPDTKGTTGPDGSRSPTESRDPGRTTAPPAATRTTPVTVPDVEGDRLSDARSRLERVGLTALRTIDATGQGRMVLQDTNWVVLSQQPRPGTRVNVATTVVLRVRKPTDSASSARPVAGVVPDVVCRDLQSAQETMRAAGFYVLVSRDGTGKDRLAIIDRNWVVIGQSVPPGTSPDPQQRIELTVVKFGEPTGSSGCRS